MIKNHIKRWVVPILFMAVLTACTSEAQPTEPPLFDSPLPAPTEPIISPQPLTGGDLILFTSTRDGKSAYYLMGPDGSAVQRLTFPDAPVEILDPTWVPALERFVFVGKEDGDEDVYLTDWERTEYENLTKNPDLVEAAPQVSPDGRWIAFVCTWADPDICIVSSDGSDYRHLTGSPAWDVNPVWSPDSQEIVYVSSAEGISDLFVIDIDEAEPTRLTTENGRHAMPDWSPDGDLIAFQSQVQEVWDIWTVSPEGGQLRNVTQSPAIDQSPKWSPDGQWIGFRSELEGNWEIYVMNAAGGEIHNVSNSPEGTEIVFGWSPDSKQLLFVSDVEGNLDIFRVNVDGLEKTNLTQHPADDGAPIWIEAP